MTPRPCRCKRARVAGRVADIQPLRTLRYDTSVAGALGDLIAPPYDVIDDAMRAELAGRSEHNVVELASNDGYLLQHFVGTGVPILGIDPAANVAKAA